MPKLRSQKGTAGLVILMAIIAIILLGIIIVPKLMKNADDELVEMDERYVTTAIKEAKVIFIQDGEPFTKVFDTENKKFVDEKIARTTVNPYGTSKENQGKYILLTIDKDGAVTTKWIEP